MRDGVGWLGAPLGHVPERRGRGAPRREQGDEDPDRGHQRQRRDDERVGRRRHPRRVDDRADDGRAAADGTRRSGELLGQAPGVGAVAGPDGASPCEEQARDRGCEPQPEGRERDGDVGVAAEDREQAEADAEQPEEQQRAGEPTCGRRDRRPPPVPA
jgi:hypothetical protein